MRRLLMAAAVAILAVFVVLVTVSSHSQSNGGVSLRGIFTRRSLQQEMKCNGMASLCDRRANEILYATVHNANAAIENKNLFANHLPKLERAVRAGYRGINMDIGLCQGEVKAFHACCIFGTRSIQSVLENLIEFLNDNPHEVLILPTQLQSDVTLAEIDEVFQSVPGWKDQLYSHPGPGTPWPTLRELIQANTRVLFFHYNNPDECTPTTCPPGFHQWFDYAVETKYDFLTLGDLSDKDSACEITRGRGGTQEFFGVNVFTTPPRLTSAVIVNQKDCLRDHLQACSDRNDGIDANLVFVDFWGAGDTIEVVHELNEKLL